jgi:hypothetical protein
MRVFVIACLVFGWTPSGLLCTVAATTKLSVLLDSNIGDPALEPSHYHSYNERNQVGWHICYIFEKYMVRILVVYRLS